MKVDNKTCYLCGSDKYEYIHHGVRGNEAIDVLECSDCGLVRLSTFEHMSDEFYEKSKMYTSSCTLLEARKLAKDDDERRFLFLQKMIQNKKILDFGCGSGGFLSYAKNTAKDVSGIELDEYMAKGLNEEGIRCYNSIESYEGSANAITMFHVLEHLPDPCSLLNKLKEKLSENGFILLKCQMLMMRY